MPQAGSIILSPKLYKLTIAGGLAFWAISVATSLLPIAAEYRAAFSNWSMQTVWVDSLIAGVIIAGCVSYSLLRSIAKSPTKDPLVESLKLSLIALVIATALVDVPRSMNGASDALYYFLVGLVFNAVRFLGLGIAIGYSYRRQYGSMRPSGSSTVKGDKK